MGVSTKSVLHASDVEIKHAEIGKKSSLTIIPKLGTKTQTRTLTSIAPVGANVQYGCHNCDIETVERGLLERVFMVKGPGGFVATPQPLVGAFDDLLSDFRNRLVRTVPSTTRLTRDEFVAQYKGRKHTLYRKAADSLNVCELERKDAYLKTFVKIEKINFTAKPDPAPRVIQPRTPRYNVELGRYLKPIEKPLYSGIDKIFGGPTVVKGMNGEQRGRLVAKCWSKFRDPVAVGLDASRFDQHVSVDALKYEHSIYNRLYRQPELRKILTWQIKNKGFANCDDGDAFYEIDGCRMSGDMNTSLGNVILMCSMMWTYLSTKGIKYRFINDGDDCILIIERCMLRRLDDLVEWFLQLGFEMERDEPVDVLEKIVFCQCQPVLGSDGTYRMVRDPRTCTAKDSITTKALREWEYDTYRKDLSDCGIALAGDMPVLGAFYDCLGRGATHNPRLSKDNARFYGGLALASKGMTLKRSPPTPETRSSFYLAFDITPDHQAAIEAEYDKIHISWSPIESLSPSIQHLSFMEF